MECKAIRSSAYTATVLLVVGLLSCGSVAGTQSSGVDHTPVTSQELELPHDPGRSLTAIVVALAPGAKVAATAMLASSSPMCSRGPFVHNSTAAT